MALGRDGNPQGPIFFLSDAQGWLPIRSQASAKDVNRSVARLLDDLPMHVDQLVRSPIGVNLGFMDRSMGGGTRWSSEVLAAVGTCHVLILLISSRYVGIKWCAKVWEEFLRRTVVRRPAASSGNRTAILPVTWLTIRRAQLPPLVRELRFFVPQQLKDQDISQRYRVEGVHGLFALNGREICRAVVWWLARRIRNVFLVCQIEPKIPVDPRKPLESFRGDDE